MNVNNTYKEFEFEKLIVNTYKINEAKLNTNSLIDKFLEGGFEKGIVTTIYGSPGSGKTNICILTAINNAKENKKIIYIDSESGFSAKRAEQILGLNDEQKLKETLSNITLIKPKTFNDQTKLIMYLDIYLKDNDIDAIIIDSISMLYRLEKSDFDTLNANKDLSKQINLLNNIAEKFNIPIIITNQVYSLFNQTEKKIVGGDIINYSSKCLIQLDKENDYRKIKLIKHRHIQEKEELFIIENKGIKSLNDE